LSHQKVRFAVATTGVCFANILMFTQLGLLSMLTEGTTRLHESLGGDLFLVSSFSPTLQFRISFPRAYLTQAAAVEGVAAASPIYIGRANWVNPSQLSDPSNSIPQTSPPPPQKRGLFGNEVRIIAFNPAVMDNRRTYVVGLFSMGSTLFEKGNVVMSDWNYAERYGSDSLDSVRIGVLTLEKGAELSAVLSRLRASLPKDVAVYTREELMQREQRSEDSGLLWFPNLYLLGGITQ
jgi:putative ABC transport system permease protein